MDELDENVVKLASYNASANIFNGYLKIISSNVSGIEQVGETITDPVKYHMMRSIGLNPDLFSNDLLIHYLNELLDNGHLMPSIQIDAKLLDNPDFINFLQRATNQHRLIELVILDKNFELTQEIYDRISFLRSIVCSFTEEGLSNNPNTMISSTYDVFIPDYGNDRDDNNTYCFSVDHELSDMEIKYLVNTVNGFDHMNHETKIDFKVYNPSLYENFINKLHQAGLNDNTTFTFIGYPLADSSSIFENINKNVPNKVNILYSCCHDLIEMYQRPPFISNSFLYSDLEPGGITSLDSYSSVLHFVENFQDKVKDYDDDLDKTVSAYNYLSDYKSYDFNHNIQDYGDTRDVDKIIDRDKIVCVGFSNLLTIMLRRTGVPCLTYGVDKHQRNIARIKVKDESGKIVQDKICVLDPTWDNGHGFTYFGLSPAEFLYTKNPEYISTATSLVLNKDDLNEYRDLSLDIPITSTTGLYWPYAYSATLLNLCGYNTSMVPSSIDGYADYCANLVENDRIGEINPEYIVNSFRKVTMMEHPEITDIDARTKTVEDSLAERETIFDYDSALHLNNYSNAYDTIYGTNDSYFINYVTPITEMMPQHEHYDIVETDSIIDIERGYINDNNTDQIDIQEEITEEIITENTETEITEEDIHTNIDIVQPSDDTTTVINDTSDIYDVHEDNNTNPNYVVNSTLGELADDNMINSYIATLLYKFNQNNRDLTPFDTYALYYLEIHPELPISIEYRERILNWLGMSIPVQEQNDTLEEDFIAGTRIRKPRDRGIYETDEEYLEYLRRYYNEYFPEARAETRETYGTYRLTRNEIIQDLPLYSKEEQVFNTPGMTDEEIEESRAKLR